MKKIVIFPLLVALFVMNSCQQEDEYSHFSNHFDIHSGLSISCWLSQESKDVYTGQVARSDYFNAGDLRFIASQGFDHVRFPVDEARFFDTSSFDTQKNMALLKNAIDTCKKLGLRVVVDLHETRFHQFRENHPFWCDTTAYKKLIKVWKKFHEELKEYPANFLAYELLNEPVPDSAAQWNRVIAKVLPVIRELEPMRKIIIGPGFWNNIEWLPTLKLPKGDSNLIMTFHFYEPYIFTHYRSGWAVHYAYEGPVFYPGYIVDSLAVEKERPRVRDFIFANLTYMDKDSMENMVKRAVKYARQEGFDLYCGEFGCRNTVPRNMRLQWYRDLISTLDAHEIPYTHWDYKCRNEFGIRTEEGEVDEELVEILAGKEKK